MKEKKKGQTYSSQMAHRGAAPIEKGKKKRKKNMDVRGNPAIAPEGKKHCNKRNAQTRQA